MANEIQVIARWKMTDRQAGAYRMALSFESFARSMFPGYKLGHRKRGDPRESDLFRWAWKAVTEHVGELRPHEYRHYAYAQLAVAKEAAATNGVDPLIWPGLLAGPRAWRRWCLWKSKNSELVSAGTAEISTRQRIDPDLARAMLKAGRNHISTMQKGLDRGKIKAAMTSGKLPRWVALGQVSGHVPLLSPAVNDWMRENRRTYAEVFGPGIESLRDDISQELDAMYREVFPEDKR